MTFPRLRELGNYWRRSPPAHVQLAGLMSVIAGIMGGAAPAGPDAPQDTATLEEFMADWRAAGGLVG
jgi:hypothetical protein